MQITRVKVIIAEGFFVGFFLFVCLFVCFLPRSGPSPRGGGLPRFIRGVQRGRGTGEELLPGGGGI